MIHLLQQTLSDASTFWAAVEALAAAGALLLLVVEVPKIKREIAAHKIEGLKFAREVLLSTDFVSAFDIIKSGWMAGGEEYPEAINPFIVSAFSKLDLLAVLIEEGYIDKKLLLYEFGSDLYRLEGFVRNFEYKKDTLIPNVRASYPKAYLFLKAAAKSAQRETRDSFDRLRNFEKQEASDNK